MQKNTLSLNVERYDLSDTSMEAIWIELRLPSSEKLLLCCIYRPPDLNIEYFKHARCIWKKKLMNHLIYWSQGTSNIDYKTDESLQENQINLIETLFLLSQMINITSSNYSIINLYRPFVKFNPPEAHCMWCCTKFHEWSLYDLKMYKPYQWKETTWNSSFSWL